MHKQRSLFEVALSLCLLTPLLAGAASSPDKIPITTTSQEARQLYLQGRDLTEKLRGTDAYPFFQKAVAKDPSFALAYCQLALTAPTNNEFFANLRKAVALAGKVTEGERLTILGLQAGALGDNAGQRRMYVQLVEKFPADERALTLLGNFYFGNQDYLTAIRYLSDAIQIAPNFTVPYNQLGYAYRLERKYPEAESTFKKYIEVLPGDPNPYDSYAELLMQLGRFDESVANYRKALEADPHFVSSLIGIANDQMFQGKGDEARKTLQQMLSVARNDAEKRQALFWTAQSYVLEGRPADAVRVVGEERAIAQASGDFVAQSGDAAYVGLIYLHSGQLDAAAASFAESETLMGKASVPAEVKEANKRNNLFNTAQVALRRGDLKTAQEQARLFQTQVEVLQIPFEVRQVHTLLGMIAIEQHDYDTALANLAKSNDQNPQVLYLIALAIQGKGDSDRARAAAKAVADFNGLHALYVFVRPDAQRLLVATR